MHPVAKVIIPPSTNTRFFFVSLSKTKPPMSIENMEPIENTEEAMPAFPRGKIKNLFKVYRYKTLKCHENGQTHDAEADEPEPRTQKKVDQRLTKRRIIKMMGFFLVVSVNRGHGFHSNISGRLFKVEK